MSTGTTPLTTLAAIDRYSREVQQRIVDQQNNNAAARPLALSDEAMHEQARQLLDDLQERRRAILASWRA
jgi:hypothetical protein